MVPKEKLGIMAKPSTRMMITLAAMSISPKLLVSDWTMIMAREKMAWVRPDGSPRRMILRALSLCAFRYRGFISKSSLILASFQKHRIADTAWAMAVARATPKTPSPRPATNHTSRTMLMTVATSRYTSAETESPSPRRTPPRML